MWCWSEGRGILKKNAVIQYCVLYNGAQRYEQFLQVSRLYRALILLGLAPVIRVPLCLRSSWCYIYVVNFFLLTSFSLLFSEWAKPGGIGTWPGWLTTNHSPSMLLHCWLGYMTRKIWFTRKMWSIIRRRHWETEHLPLPDRVSGTAFILPSVIRHCRRQSSESCWKLICLFKGRGAGDLWTGALEMYWLTN